MAIIAIIPARSGSKSIPDKNLADVSGYPLLAYSIAIAKMSKLIDRVIVSTDSPFYQELAIGFGAEAPFLRPSEMATDAATDQGFLRHAIEWVERVDAISTDYWVQLRPTTPLRHPDLIDDAIRLSLANPTASSLRSAHASPEPPNKWLKRKGQLYFTGFMSGSDDKTLNLPKEAFEKAYIPNGYIDIVRRNVLMNTDSVYGNEMLALETPSSVEVDSPDELEYVRFLLKRNGSKIYEFLQATYKNGEV